MSKDEKQEPKQESDYLKAATSAMAHTFKENEKELKQALGSKQYDTLKEQIDGMDKIVKSNLLGTDRDIVNTQKGTIKVVSDNVNRVLDKTAQNIDDKSQKGTFSKVKNVIKAAAKVVTSGGSKEARTELAAAQFAMSGKDKLDKFKSAKAAVQSAISSAKQEQKGQGQGR